MLKVCCIHGTPHLMSTSWEKFRLRIFFFHHQPCIHQYKHSAVLLISPQMYHFTNFAMALNELEPGMEAVLAPTDCRFRPDIRAMENGNMGNMILMSYQHLMIL